MDEQQLTQHLKDLPDTVEQIRSLLYVKAATPDEIPTFNSFGPRSPLSEGILELADQEVAWLGNTAKHCITQGTIPPTPLKAMWWINGTCKGLKGGYEEDTTDLTGKPIPNQYRPHLQATCQHLTTWAPQVLKTEGIQPYLEQAETIRRISNNINPNNDKPADNLITMQEALERFNITKRTFYNWIKAGTVTTSEHEGTTLYREQDLQLIEKIRKENRKHSSTQQLH